jgi:hypothetical protein
MKRNREKRRRKKGPRKREKGKGAIIRSFISNNFLYNRQ